MESKSCAGHWALRGQHRGPRPWKLTWTRVISLWQMQQKLREPGTEETWGLTQETLSLLETEAGPGNAVGSEASDDEYMH